MVSGLQMVVPQMCEVAQLIAESVFYELNATKAIRVFFE
jgi:hypothetical protein